MFPSHTEFGTQNQLRTESPVPAAAPWRGPSLGAEEGARMQRVRVSLGTGNGRALQMLLLARCQHI